MRVHVEGGGLLGMKWTKPLERRTCFFQGCPTGTDQTYNVSSFRNPANKIFTERHELLKQGYHPQEACEEAIKRIRDKYKSIDFQVAYIALRIDGEVGAAAIENGFSYVLSYDNETNLHKVVKK